MSRSYSNIHPVDEILKGIVSEAVQSDDSLIADKVFANATIQVPERSGELLKYPSRDMTGSGAGIDSERAPGTSRQRVNSFNRSIQNFYCKEYALESAIAYEDIRDSQYPMDEETRALRILVRTSRLNREKRAADLLFDSTQFETSTCTAIMGGKIDAAGTRALEGLRKVFTTNRNNAHGVDPDTLILGYDVFEALLVNADMRRFFGDSTLGVASGDLMLSDIELMNRLKSRLGIKNIYVGSARSDSAVPGATSNEGFIWNNETIFMGCLSGAEQIANARGAVRTLPVAALNFELESLNSGMYEPPGMITKNVYVSETQVYKAIDSKLGFVVTDCLV
jgi:hypothetical protein